MVVIPDVLLRGSRPGRRSDKCEDVDAETVDAWIKVVQEAGVRTILCLLDGKQLGYYRRLGEGGLLSRYRAAGFEVISRPVEDHLEPPVEGVVLETIASDFLSATFPMLVHCSAGSGRTGAVVDYLVSNPHLQVFRKNVFSLMNENSRVRKIGHFKQVTRLAIRLYDELRSIHELPPRYRAILWASAMLHDIGTNTEGLQAEHAWRSGKMILKHRADFACGALLKPEEIATVASLHRIDKALLATPLGRIDDAILTLWPDQEIPRELQILAGILRVADGLDRDLYQPVEDLKVQDDRIKVIIKTGCEAVENIRRAQKKSGLLCTVLNCDWRIE